VYGNEVSPNLQQRLDAFLSGECAPAAFVKELSEFSRVSSSSSWESLALLDQYHRRGKLSGDLFRAFRRQIEFDVLGVADPVAAPASNDDSITTASSATELDEVQALRAALAREREKTQRYEKRIVSLRLHSHRQRAARRWPSLANLLTTARRSYLRSREWSSLAKAQRSYHHAHGWSLVMLMTAALVIAGSAPEIPVQPVAIAVPVALPVVAEVLPPAEPAVVEPETITLSSERYIVFPGSRTATIQVARAGGAGGPISFRWWTESSTAKAGTDYAAARPKVVEMGAGEEFVELSVPILANPKRKHTELFYVVIGSPSENAELGPTRRATVFIMRPEGKQTT
jgi:Calx-beta domain